MSAFNSYTINLNLSTLKEYCINHGEMIHFSRGDIFEIEGLKSQRIGYVAKGCFKYIVHNNTENRDYITGFSFENEFVCDFPNCMNQQPAVVSIVALENTDVCFINGTPLPFWPTYIVPKCLRRSMFIVLKSVNTPRTFRLSSVSTHTVRTTSTPFGLTKRLVTVAYFL